MIKYVDKNCPAAVGGASETGAGGLKMKEKDDITRK